MSRVKELLGRYKIYKTTNYDQFVLYEKYHSPTSKERMEKVERSILKFNLLALRPIWVTDKMEVVHGRHRLNVAKRHGKDVYFRVGCTSEEYHRWIKETYGEDVG
jgi:hypothetical protein